MTSPFYNYSWPAELLESFEQGNVENTENILLDRALTSFLLHRCHTTSTEISSSSEEPIEIKKLYLLQNAKQLNKSTSTNNINKLIKKRTDYLHNSAGTLATIQKVRFSNELIVRYYVNTSFNAYKDKMYVGL